MARENSVRNNGAANGAAPAALNFAAMLLTARALLLHSVRIRLKLSEEAKRI